jgi:four helix bundle protein
MARSFEETEVWKESRDLVKIIYQLTRKGAFGKDYGLTDQIRRAGVSVMSNIAEGFERGTNGEFMHFLFMAKGSAGEVRSQLYVAFDQGYLSDAELERSHEQCRIVSSQLGKLIQYLKRSPLKGEKHKPVAR